MAEELFKARRGTATGQTRARSDGAQAACHHRLRRFRPHALGMLDCRSKSGSAPDATATTARKMHSRLYVWPFYIKLPTGIQATTLVNEPFGNISFRLEVFIDTVWGPGIECAKELHVVPRELLYSTPDLVVSILKRDSKKTSRIFSFMEGELVASVTWPDAVSFAEKLSS